jgi:hypothetical protein
MEYLNVPENTYRKQAIKTGSIKICNPHKNPIKLHSKHATYREQFVYTEFIKLFATIMQLYDLDDVFHTKPIIALLALRLPLFSRATCLTYNVLLGSIRTGAHRK